MKHNVLEEILRCVRDCIDRILDDKCVPSPGPIQMRIAGEKLMLVFDVVIGQPIERSPDVVRGELTVNRVANGVATTDVIVTTPDQTEVIGLSGDDGSTVSLSFVYVDDAENRSANPATFTAVLTDTIPPSDPGSLGIVITGEQ